MLRALDAAIEGLPEAEVGRRLARDGANAVAMTAPLGFARAVARQLRSPLVVVLGVAIALSLAVGAFVDAAFVAAVVAVNAAIGGFQEWRADASARALRAMLPPRATVVRAGRAVAVDATTIVAGDILLVESGDRVAADARLVESAGLEVDESLLTGESVPVGKDAGWRGTDAAVPLGERANMLHSGTTVVRGRGSAVVVATGSRSAVGRLAHGVDGAARGKPPLVLRLERFSRAIGGASLAAAVAVALVGWLWRGHAPLEMAVFAIALAVSVIPEGLPVAVTVALSIAARRMARRGVVVRRLDAVEGLGSCTLLLSDKTGTLTRNALAVREARLPSGTTLEVRDAESGAADDGSHRVSPPVESLDAEDRAALARLLDACVLPNEAVLADGSGETPSRGDPIDLALLDFARELGVSRPERLASRPERRRTEFESDRRYASSVHGVDGAPVLFAKGAPERIAAMCGERAGVDLGAARTMAESGLRVLAMADGEVSGEADDAVPSGLRASGLVGMIDPLRPDAAEAVRRCREAGVSLAIVTGDHPATALAIARDLGLVRHGAACVTGRSLDALEDAALGRMLASGEVAVFARVEPAQKLRIVECARRAGHLVAVTGDGANDAPALKAANIGVAMGRSGTDAAREAADLVIADDRLATIVDGVEEGRVAYANIRKVVHLLVSTNGAEVLIVVGAIAAGLPLPLLPTQLLWLNLATEGLQDVALAFEPSERDVLAQPPRPADEPVFDRLMIERLVVGAVVIGGVSLAYFAWMLGQGVAEDAARNRLLLLMVLFENAQAGNSRSETRSVFASWPWRNPVLLGAVVAGLGLQLAAMHVPWLRAVLGTTPLPARDWIACAAMALLAIVAIEAHKWSWWIRRRGARPTERG